ncbi:MalY/PatB family protein, partial [Thermodesulfobacteriota bacterium]
MKREYDFDFDKPVDRLGTSSEKWDMYEQHGVIPLWLADMDFRSPTAVIEALHQRVDHGVFGYTRVPDDLAAQIISMLDKDYAWKVDKKWLVWLPSLVTGLNVACRSAGSDGDEVLTAVPVYPPFLSAPGHARRRLVTVPLVQIDGNWVFDFDSLERSITPGTRLFLLCSPHNPVGRVYSRDELARLADICNRHDIIICSDEIHCGLVLDRDKPHIPTATLSPEIADRTITLMSPSKTYNLPGLG